MKSFSTVVILVCVCSSLTGQVSDKESVTLDFKIAEHEKHVLFVGQIGKDSKACICKLSLTDYSITKVVQPAYVGSYVRFVDMEKKVCVIDDSESLGPGKLIGYTFEGNKIWEFDWCSCTEAICIDPVNGTVYFNGNKNGCYRFSLTTGKKIGTCKAFDRPAGIESDKTGKHFVFQNGYEILISHRQDLKDAVKLCDGTPSDETAITSAHVFVSSFNRFRCFDLKSKKLLWKSDQFETMAFVREVGDNKMAGLRLKIVGARGDIEKVEFVTFDASTGKIFESVLLEVEFRFEYLSSRLALVNGNEIREIPSMKLLKKLGK